MYPPPNDGSGTAPPTTSPRSPRVVKQPEPVIMIRGGRSPPSSGNFRRSNSGVASSNNSTTSSNGESDQAVAAASALVGETVLDSSRTKRKTNHRSDHADGESNNSSSENDNKGVNRHVISRNTVDLAAEEAAMSVGLMAVGLAWVQRQKERRRRNYLQNQAERQLRKIAEAENIHNPRPPRSLAENPTFQTITHSGHPNSDQMPEEEGVEGPLKIGLSPKVSTSGEGASGRIDIFDDDDESESWIPKVRVEEEAGVTTNYILTPEQMQQIAIHVLPKTISFCRWRRLYGLGRDGDSFAACLRLIEQAPRTLMVVRTTRGAVFGGYADSPWRGPQEHAGSRFYGSAQACLFKVIPGTEKVKVFKWTGANRYIQLCDISSKMLAFGGGGDEGAFALCVQEDFQFGSTGRCDTFDNEPLCEEENFDILDLEFWEFLTGVF